MMPEPAPNPSCTVLIADLVGSTQLYQQVGDRSAFELVDRCLRELGVIATSRSGHVIKHTGDGIIAVFCRADDAADAAIGMHAALRDMTVVSTRMAVRVGFHTGQVIESGSDIFGETVNIAARLVELASPGRALTTLETSRTMSLEWRTLLNALPPRILRGVTRPAELFELRCENFGDITVVQDTSAPLQDAPELRLYLNEQRIVINEHAPMAVLGRDPGSDLRVGDQRASRRHAAIELRGDKFVLVDRSSNGTYIIPDGEKEFLLSREEAVLRGQGQIALGRSASANPYSISFICL